MSRRDLQVETLCPDSLSLVPARKRLQEFQVGHGSNVECRMNVAKPLANELNPGGNQAANQPHPGLDHTPLIRILIDSKGRRAKDDTLHALEPS